MEGVLGQQLLCVKVADFLSGQNTETLGGKN